MVDMPSFSGMFVFRHVTSAVTNSALVGSDGRFSMRLRKCFVSLICDVKL